LGIKVHAGDIGHDGSFHGGDHLAVEVVQQGDWEKEGDNGPGVAGGHGRILRGGWRMRNAKFVFLF
jgi:hypothetical protein